MSSKGQEKDSGLGPLNRVLSTPYPLYGLSILNLGMIRAHQLKVPGAPSLLQCGWFAIIYGLSGYAIQQGDVENGSGIASAWSMTWLFFNAKKAIKSRAPLPIAMLATIGTLGSAYSYKYYKYAF